MKRPPKQTGAERNAKLLAEQILQKISGLTISDTSIWRCAQKWSAKIHMAEEGRAKTAVGLPQRGQIIRRHVPHARPMGVAMDASVRAPSGGLVSRPTASLRWRMRCGAKTRRMLTPGSNPRKRHCIKDAPARLPTICVT